MIQSHRIFDRRRLLLLLGLLLTTGFFATTLFGYFVSKDAIRSTIIGQDLPLLISFLPGAFLRFLGCGAIIQCFLDEGAKLWVQPFGAFLPQHLFGGVKGLLRCSLGRKFFGQGAPFRLGFQAAEFLQRD